MAGKNIRVSGFVKESIVDGSGIRYVIFTQGCPHKCEGCHNPETHSFDAGVMMSEDEIFSDIIKNPLLSGVTFSGGEPFMQVKELLPLAKKIKKAGLNLWAYSGFTFEELLAKSKKLPELQELLQQIDILVDGKFILEEKTLMAKFRGSKNQRVINVKDSLESGKVVIADIQ